MGKALEFTFEIALQGITNLTLYNEYTVTFQAHVCPSIRPEIAINQIIVILHL